VTSKRSRLQTQIQIGVLLVLFFASGAAALIYQVLWLRELGRLFGATAYAAATTLAVFFLGLSAGGLAWGRSANRLGSPLRTYAFLELGIAVTALAFFGLLDVYRWAYQPLFSVFGDRPLTFLAVKFLLATGTLFLPAFFMGGTLPVMGQYLVRRADEFGRKVSLLYAINTAGAAAGALAAGFYLPVRLGFRNSYLVAIALNVAIAGVAFLWSRYDPLSDSPRRESSEVAGDFSQSGDFVKPGVFWGTAFASGFLTLGLEVLWTRMFAQVLQNSVYTFAVVLTVFLVALALGSVLANFLCRCSWSPPVVLFGLLTLAGFLVGLTPLY
jgi:spermidine synthase